MSITDELREWAVNHRAELDMGHLYPAMIEGIADRIDIAHKHAIGYVDDRDPETMAENGWVRLPVDADGEVIHIGELVDEKLPFGGYAAPAPVDTMELSRGAGGYGWMVKLDSESGAFINPKLLRHHHAPTVEDVLREFTDEVWDRCCEGATASDSGIDELVAEYAAKLALRGDE